jgi:hypothetical protein
LVVQVANWKLAHVQFASPEVQAAPVGVVQSMPV